MPGSWLLSIDDAYEGTLVDGLVLVHSFDRRGKAPEVVAVMEKAEQMEADAVFFEAPWEGKPPQAQAFIYKADGPATATEFAKLHKRLWSWGGVPLAYRVTHSTVQLFRCAHRPDFEGAEEPVFNPYDTLRIAGAIATQHQAKAWWNAAALRNGTLWDDPAVCKELLSSKDAAQKTLIKAIRDLHSELERRRLLPNPLRRKLLILSVLIKYLEARKVFEDDFFGKYLRGATCFFDVMKNGPALLKLLNGLEERFNGNVFTLRDEEAEAVRTNGQLSVFAQVMDERQDGRGQLRLWDRYSFSDLPVELISHIYQLFVADSSVAVYTPHFVVRLMVGEVLSWERLDRLAEKEEVILDGACGSGIFLVEAYKRLVLHWRYRNGWARPKQNVLKKLLTTHIRGVDLDEGAVELAAFSLCLALCDALQPQEIRASVKLFPPLMGKRIYHACFFDACVQGLSGERIGVVLGNPPFKSGLTTEGAERAYMDYQSEHGLLPDKQLAYLFLHESMKLLAPGGVLSMVQQYNLLYNQQSRKFRRRFFERWDVREVLDFVSVRGLFQKGNADTKVIVVVAEARHPKSNRRILHATFRRSGRADAEQGFDIDHYDMHWLPRALVLTNDNVWRSGLLGGGRVLGFVERLGAMQTLGEYATEQQWEHGEGYIVADTGPISRAAHLTGKRTLPSEAIGELGIDARMIKQETAETFRSKYRETRFTPPMLLIREHMDLYHDVWTKDYLAYKNKVVGFAADKAELGKLMQISDWIKSEGTALKAYAAATSVRLFTQKATTLSGADIEGIPYPAGRSLNLTAHEHIIAEDVVEYYRDLVRLGEGSRAMKEHGVSALPAFNRVFVARINSVYKKNKLLELQPLILPGLICQPYVFGTGRVDWNGADELRGKLNDLLQEKRDSGLNITRVARLYDGACIYMLKPDRLRYWIRSIALRDADETLADLAAQGF